MKKLFKNFSFPFTNLVLILSGIMIFLPLILMNILDTKNIIDNQPQLFKLIILIPSLLATLGFVYCTLGYHIKTAHGDELKFRIHLESLHVAFTSTLVSLFILIFIFLNFEPEMLNWLLVIVAIIAILSYLIASGFIKDKYQ
jgi:amino acid transporter